MDLYLIFKIILIGFAILSWIGFKTDRSENKQNLNELIDDDESIRELTSTEVLLLEPYLTNKESVFPYKHQSSLVNINVSIITGACTRHSLYSDSEETSFYYKINGIEVFFPYNMERYLAETNVTEVVFTERYAIIVNINDYDLQTAADSVDDEKQIEEDWLAGRSNSFINIKDETTDTITGSSLTSEKYKKRNYEIIEQREETPLESAIRTKHNTGWLAVLFLILAVTFFVRYWCYDGSQIIIMAFAFLFLSLFCCWHKPKSEIYNVNRVRGTIDDNNIVDCQIIVGDTLVFKYPEHWRLFLPENTTADVEMDVSLDDNKLLRYGYSLSIGREVEQFGPPKFLKRNFLLFFTGLILSGVVLYVSNVMDNALFSYRIINETVNTININDSTLLKNGSLQKGDLVNIQLNGASCDVTHSDNYDQCKKIIINTQPTTDANFSVKAIPNWMIDLFDENLIETVDDMSVKYAQQSLKSELKLLNELYRTHGNYNRYSENVKLTKLLHVGHLITVVNESCKASDIDECKFIKRFLLKLITTDTFSEENWSAVVEYGHKFPEFDSLVVFFQTGDLTSSIRELRAKLLAKQIEQLKPVVASYQKNESKLGLTVVNNQDASIITLTNDIGDISKEILPLIYYYNTLSGKGGNIHITGLVTDFDYHDDNSISTVTINADPHFSMDKDELTSFTSPIIINIVFFAVIVLITLWNGLMFFWKLLANRRRYKNIIGSYANLVI